MDGNKGLPPQQLYVAAVRAHNDVQCLLAERDAIAAKVDAMGEEDDTADIEQRPSTVDDAEFYALMAAREEIGTRLAHARAKARDAERAGQHRRFERLEPLRGVLLSG